MFVWCYDVNEKRERGCFFMPILLHIVFLSFAIIYQLLKIFNLVQLFMLFKNTCSRPWNVDCQ